MGIEYFSGNEFRFIIKEIETTMNLKESIDILDSNSKYIAATNKNFPKNIFIYSINRKEDNFLIKEKSKISCETIIFNYQFHPNYSQILLSSLVSGKVNLWKLDDDENYKLLSNIYAFDSFVYFSKFNPKNDNIFLSCSGEQIKIFDINKYYYIYNSDISDSFNNTLKWRSEFEYSYIKNNLIITMDYKNNKEKERIEINDIINDFYFMNDYYMIIINNNSIKKYDIRNYSQPINTKEEFFSYNIYNNDFDFFYLIKNNHFQILDLKEFKIVKSYLIDENIKNPLLLNNNFLNKKNYEIANILYDNDCGKRKTITIEKKINYPTFSINRQIKEIPLSFYKSVKKNISDYYAILAKNENEEIEKDEKIKIKKYIYNKEIEKEIKELENVSLFDRKKQVNIKKIKEIDLLLDLKEKYLSYIKLLLRDNTNEELLIKYLCFLQSNEIKLNKIKGLFIEPYNNEIEFYKVIFSKEKLLKQFKKIKLCSEKENFINLLKKISDIIDICIKEESLLELNRFKISLPKKMN